MKKFKFLASFFALLLLVGGGCAAGDKTNEDQEDGHMNDGAMEMQTVKVGFMGPLSGDAASYGENALQGVELALKDLGLENVALVTQDSRCEAKDAVSAVNQLINAEGVAAIVGELCSGATLAAAPVANENEVVMVSPASTAPTVSEAGDFIFRTIPSDAAQGNFGAQLVHARGFSKLAVIAINDDYGVGFDAVLREQFPRLDGEVVASEFFQKGDADMRTQLTKIKNAGADALYIISNSPDAAVAVVEQAQELGLPSALFGSEGLKGDEIASVAPGLVVTAPKNATQAFMDTFTAEYGAAPGTFAAQGYDAMMALGKVIEGGAYDGAAIRDALNSLTFDGVTGLIEFDSYGDVSGEYDVFVAEGGTFVLSSIDG